MGSDDNQKIIIRFARFLLWVKAGTNDLSTGQKL